MTTINSRLAARAAAAVERDGDQSEVAQGGGAKVEYKLAPEGKTKARLAGYIERGPQARKPYKGVAKEPANQFILRFALYGDERHQNSDGSPIMVDSRPFTAGRSELSLALKNFIKMCPKGDAKHYIELIDRVFWLNIVHRKGEAKDGKEAPVFVNIDGDIVPAVVDVMDENDVVVGVRPAACPALDEKFIQIYEWDVPSKEDFDSLRKSDQKKLRGSTAFVGSALEALVGGGNPAAAGAPEEEPQEPVDETPAPSEPTTNVSVDASDMPDL